MLDRHLHPRIKPLLHQCVRVLDKPGITPDGLTLVGFAIGVLALPFLALGWYLAALVVILLNRLLDGLDGALARRRELTDAGLGARLVFPRVRLVSGCRLRSSVRGVRMWCLML